MGGKPSKGTPADKRLKANKGKKRSASSAPGPSTSGLVMKAR